LSKDEKATVTYYDLGLMEYEKAWKIQLRLMEMRADGRFGDVILLVEHPHVFTLGRKGDASNILDENVPVYRVERGGDATYHGPGQLVVYPIIDINSRGMGVKEFVTALEEVCIAVLRQFGVEATLQDGKPGVWVNSRKIASIGLAIRHWVTFHGLALNANTDMSYFRKIRPCGMEGEIMVSLRQLLGREVTLEEIRPLFLQSYSARFGVKLVRGDNEELEQAVMSARADSKTQAVKIT